MLNQESNTNANINILERLLLLFYNIDIKLNGLFNSTTISFGKSSSLIKSIFNPFQKYGSNLSKLINQPEQRTNITRYLEFVKENTIVITTQLQFHDVIEQRLRHIRLIHNEIIQDLIAQKKSPGKRHNDDFAYIKMISQINTAQISNINDEYIEHCRKLDESLQLFKKYLAEWEGFLMDTSISNPNDDLQFLARQNVELSNRVVIITSDFATDISYRNTIANIFSEITKSFNSIAFEIKIKDKLPSSDERLKKLEGIYTTVGEREVFNKVVYAGGIQKKSHFLKTDSGVEFF